MSSCITGKILFRLNWTAFRRRIPLWKEGALFNKSQGFVGSWASTPNAGRPSFFFDWSFEHQFNSTSRTLSKTIGKWVLLMWGVRTLRGAVITNKATKLKFRLPVWPTFALLQQQQNRTMCHFFWNQRKFFFWFVYTPLHLSTLV